MELTKILNVSSKELDTFIQTMVVEDVKKATGKLVNIKDIGKGYKYRKALKSKMGKSGKVTTRIDELRENCYKASFESAQGTNTLSYTYHSIADEQTEVTYAEEFYGESSSKNWNFNIVSFFYKRSTKKRIKLMLEQIESYIQNNRQSAV